MPNKRLKKKILTAYIEPEDYNILKFFALSHQVSISKLVDDALYKLILEDGDTCDYPRGGYKNER